MSSPDLRLTVFIVVPVVTVRGGLILAIIIASSVFDIVVFTGRE